MRRTGCTPNLGTGPGWPTASCAATWRRLSRCAPSRRGESMSEVPGEVWESDDWVRRTLGLPALLAERLAGRGEQRGLSFSDLLVEYAQGGLDRDRADGS